MPTPNLRECVTNLRNDSVATVERLREAINVRDGENARDTQRIAELTKLVEECDEQLGRA